MKPFTEMNDQELTGAFAEARSTGNDDHVNEIIAAMADRRIAAVEACRDESMIELPLLRAALLVETGEHAESALNAHEFMNQVFGLVYPDDPTSWEYPAQIVRHVESYINELKERAEVADRATRNTPETDAQRQARELAHKEYERLHTEGAQKFGMMWLRANIPMSRLANAKYLPVGAAGEMLPHVKTLLSAAAWVLCEHEAHNAEIFERQHQRGFIQYEALADIARTITPTMSMALDGDHLTNLLTAKLRGVIDRAAKALADDNAPIPPELNIKELTSRAEKAEQELKAVKAERDTARGFAKTWKLAAKTARDNERFLLQKQNAECDSSFASQDADDDCCDDDTPPRYYCAPESLQELRRFASLPDGEWRESESSADADYLCVVGMIEWDGNWEPQRYRIGEYGRETLRRVDELPPVDPQRFNHQYVVILNDGRYAFDMRPAERQGYWQVTLESTRVIIEVPESYIVGESPF